jgi:hypothetical protein
MRWMAAVLALWLGTPLLQGCAETTGAARPTLHAGEGDGTEEIASRFRLPRISSRKSKSPAANTPSAPVKNPPTASPNPNRHLLSSIEPWRKPRLTDDKRILPYGQTRQPASPIPNLGLNRAGKSISDGRHTISFDENGFPRFNARFEMLLGKEHLGTGNRQSHIKAANESLAKTIKKDPVLAKELGLVEKDVSALSNSHQAPTGYRWHHHQDVGRMQLVKFEEHRLATPHTGGMAIWGGGYP